MNVTKQNKASNNTPYASETSLTTVRNEIIICRSKLFRSIGETTWKLTVIIVLSSLQLKSYYTKVNIAGG